MAVTSVNLPDCGGGFVKMKGMIGKPEQYGFVRG
jgi:hypothetical protein